MAEKTNILIVGAGKGGKALIEIFTESKTVNIIGVVDINQDSPGIKLAKELNIPTASGYKEFINNKGLNEIFNSTGNNKVQEELIEDKPAGVEIIDGRSAKFLWEMIEERKGMEEALRRNEERFRQIVNAAEEWVWEVDKDGLYTYSNTVVEKILGYKPEEIIGKKYFFDLFIPEAKESLKKGSFKVFNAKKVFRNFLNQNQHKNGSVVFLETSGSPVLDNQGNLIGYRGIDSDVTERKRADEELKMAYTKLKETQDQLIQSAKIASLGLLAGGIAHEINNPLTGVLNNVQLIKMIVAQKKDFNLEDFKQLLGSIEESAQRCSNITRSLLDFSHASKGKIQAFSLNEIIEKTIILIEHELQLQDIVIQNELKADLPLIKGDPQLIQQVIFNIVSNAKWSILNKPEKHGGVIVIKTDNRVGDNRVSLDISDTGIGISKENLEKIFDPFFTTKLVGEGTGLGLSIVYNIIKEHKGVITAESEVDKGTIFKILLPVNIP